jgi:hypothetical protein
MAHSIRNSRQDFWNKARAFAVPALFAAYPALAMYSASVDEVRFSQVGRALLFSILLALGLTLLLMTVLHHRQKASLIATCWLIVFFAYGHVHDVLFNLLGPQVGRHMVLLPVAAVLILVSAFWIWKSNADLSRLHTYFGLMALILVAMVSFSLASYFLFPISRPGSPSNQAAAPSDANAVRKPDIYYIILDGYGRQDILRELYGYDNSEFINFLGQHGFYVADSSHSNYAQTRLSMSSSLNMEYLDTIGLPTKDPQVGRTWLADKIIHSRVRQLLADQGYQLVLFSHTLTVPQLDADIFFDFGTTAQAVAIKDQLRINQFEEMFLSSTLGQVAVDLGWLSFLNSGQLYRYHYAQTRYIFEKLGEIPSMPGSYFVYAHIIAPHPPFVFDAQGGFIENKRIYSEGDGSSFIGSVDEYVSRYRDQVAYVDRAMETVLETILAESDPAPMIIIQGDHGPGAYLEWESADGSNLDERLSILNAYYFPGDHSGALYPSISPVNSFRVLLDEYFGMNFPLLDDRSYFSTWSHPFDYIDVTDKLKK